ncbi:MAG: hypothetical protein ACPGWR_26160 [Ardenticatenaceae bacterium]
MIIQLLVERLKSLRYYFDAASNATDGPSTAMDAPSATTAPSAAMDASSATDAPSEAPQKRSQPFASLLRLTLVNSCFGFTIRHSEKKQENRA